jgi:hypothetical protein
VHLDAPARLLGTVQPVRITEGKLLSLTGTVVPADAEVAA